MNRHEPAEEFGRQPGQRVFHSPHSRKPRLAVCRQRVSHPVFQSTRRCRFEKCRPVPMTSQLRQLKFFIDVDAQNFKARHRERRNRLDCYRFSMAAFACSTVISRIGVTGITISFSFQNEQMPLASIARSLSSGRDRIATTAASLIRAVRRCSS